MINTNLLAQTWVPKLRSNLICLLALAIGFHLPRSFIMLYGLVVLLCWSVWAGPKALADLIRQWWLPLLTTTLFAVSYGVGMLRWGFWTWTSDRSDLINALLLPTLLLLAGLGHAQGGSVRSADAAPARSQTAETPQDQTALSGKHDDQSAGVTLLTILISYGLGSLLYALITLAINRHPWWDVSQVFEHSVRVPWGTTSMINVRSIEQNAIPALALLPSCLTDLLGRCRGGGLGWRAALGTVLGLLGLHAVLSFQGRLWIVVFLLAALPWAALGMRRLLVSRRQMLLPQMAAAALALSLLLHRYRTGAPAAAGWSQGLCDERLSLYLSILRHAGSFLWGGRQLVAPYQLCDGSAAVLAPRGGSLAMAHNLLLDVFRDTGVLTAVLLLISMLTLLIPAMRGFLSVWRQRRWDGRIGCLWGWFVLLLCQWSFQPLLYADGLLYYMSFFVFGALAAHFSRCYAQDHKQAHVNL